MNAITYNGVSEPAVSRQAVELLDSVNESIFAMAAPGMVRHGWSVFPQEREGRRMPGKMYGQTIKWQAEHDLVNHPPRPEVLREWCQHLAGLNVAVVFGPASGHTFAVDIDVTDAPMSRAILAIAEDIMGPTPFMRIGQAPKIALIYRHAADDVVPSTSRRIAAHGDDEPQHGLEILGRGKPLTFHGRHHRTGRYFTWIDDASPLIHGPERAPEVSSQQVAEFLAAIDAKFPFTKAAAFCGGSAAAEWSAETVAGSDIVVARVTRDSEEKITEGREEYLRRLVWQTVRANGNAVLAAHAAGSVAAISASISAAVAAEFSEVAECSGRWAPATMKREAAAKVTAAVAKIVSGHATPSRPQAHVTEPKLEAEVAAAVAGAPATTKVTSARVRPIIRMEVGEIERVLDHAEAALASSGRGIYQRGGDIVTIGETPVVTAAGFEIGAQRIFQVGEHALLEHLSSAARWESYDARKESKKEGGQADPWKKASPQMWIAKTLLQRTGRLSLPVLSGVVSAPTMRADGSLLTAEGYDARTGLLLDTRGAAFPAIPEAPDREAAEAAMGRLKALISTMPFVSDADRSVALAAFLTATVRRSLRTAPMFAYTAPVAGSGKSMLVDIASILATGREAGVVAQGRDEAETEKRLGSLLLGGSALIAFDNCVQPVGGDLFCQLLTQPTVCPRILGRSESPEVPTASLVCANGNNLVLLGDMTRRALLCKLDPKCERPELRVFDTNPVEEAKARRGELVAAALTVLRAYYAAGRPAQKSPLGSFGEWSRTVRDALLWLGEADPVSTMEEARAVDPQLEAVSSVMAQWAHVVGTKRVTARDLIEAATAGRLGPDGRQAFAEPDFREALLSVAGDGGAVSGKRLGKWLQANAGRVVGGCQIARVGTSGGTANWQLEISAGAPLAAAVRTTEAPRLNVPFFA